MDSESQIIIKLKTFINNNDNKALINLINSHNIVDMAKIIKDLNVEEIIYLFLSLPAQTLGDIFTYLPFTIQHDILDVLSVEEIVKILDNVYTDDVVDFLSQLEEKLIDNILQATVKPRQNQLKTMLKYPQDCAGGLLSKDYIKFTSEITVKEATEKIKVLKDRAEMTSVFYIIDVNNKLLGVVSIRDILLAPEDLLISDLMTKDIISVKDFDSKDTVIKQFYKYDLISMPVIDQHNHFIGFISADDIMDSVQEEATQDMHKMAGVLSKEPSYLYTSPKLIAKSRVLWLIILTVAYTISSFIITGNEALIEVLPSIMVFVPLLMNTAGDAGSQALAMVVRGIAVDGLDTSSFKLVLKKEFKIAIIAGAFLFIANMLRIYFFSTNTHDFWLAFVVSITVFLVVIIAKFIGGILPLIALKLNQDPASMASPLITTLSDSITLLLYFSIVKIFVERLV